MQQHDHSVKGGNTVAFHKQECQIHTLCRYGSLRVWKEEKKKPIRGGLRFPWWSDHCLECGPHLCRQTHTLGGRGWWDIRMRIPAIKAHERTLRKGLSRGSDVYIHQHTTSESNWNIAGRFESQVRKGHCRIPMHILSSRSASGTLPFLTGMFSLQICWCLPYKSFGPGRPFLSQTAALSCLPLPHTGFIV